MHKELEEERSRMHQTVEAERQSCASRLREMQAAMDKEAATWVEEMAATRERDQALLRGEVKAWADKSKELTAELDTLRANMETEIRRRVAAEHEALHAERAELRATLTIEREQLARAREEDARNRESERLAIMQKAMAMRDHMTTVRSRTSLKPETAAEQTMSPERSTGAGAPPPKLGGAVGGVGGGGGCG
eukprot:6173347-Pleurochrysis_carterae.AAC.1